MKVLMTCIVLLGSFSLYAQNNYLFECHGKAVEAAKAIDEVNFKTLERSSVVVSDRSQKIKSAKIDVAFDETHNRRYTIKLVKTRSATLRGDNVQEETGCVIDSVSVN